MLAAIGFFILPAKRQRAKAEMREKIAARARSDCRRRSASSSRRKSSAAAIGSATGIAPYSRFVRGEGDNLKLIEQELREIGDELAALRARVDRIAA